MCYGRLCGNPVSLVLCSYTVIHSTSIYEKIIAKSSYLSSRHSHPIIHSGTVIASITPAQSSYQSPRHFIASILPAQPSQQSPRHSHRIDHIGTFIASITPASHPTNHPGTVIASITPAQSSHQSSWHSHRIDRHVNTITLSQFALL